VARVVLFHHVLGLTDGVVALADDWRAAGHEVVTPDLYDGQRASTVDDGLTVARAIGDEELERRAVTAAGDHDAVFAGISLGVVFAQRLAQMNPHARGAILLEGCLPISGEWAIGPWPAAVPVQIHGMDQDPYFALEGDIDAAREIVATVGSPHAELFMYPGDRHLFTDNSLPSYDADATARVTERALALLERIR
jgi:dienelactone hydrolase